MCCKEKKTANELMQRLREYLKRYHRVLKECRRLSTEVIMNQKPLTEVLLELREIDIRSVDPNDLVDIEDVKIRTDLPVGERLKDFIHQIKNPYCYRSHGVTVKISFAGKRKLEDCLISCIEMECGLESAAVSRAEGRVVG